MSFPSINRGQAKNRQTELCHFLGNMHPTPGRQNPHTLSNKHRISLNADGLIASRYPCLELQDWQQQPRLFSLMALHVFPSKAQPKSIVAVFSAIASRSSQVLPKSGALDILLFNSARSREDGKRIRRKQLRHVTLLRSSVAFSGSGEPCRKETFRTFPQRAESDHTSRISRRACCTKCTTLFIEASILPPRTHHFPLYTPA